MKAEPEQKQTKRIKEFCRGLLLACLPATCPSLPLLASVKQSRERVVNGSVLTFYTFA
jgi:hypothetical protein